jgi:hypothetical protein
LVSFFTLLDTAILSYPPVQETGTSILNGDNRMNKITVKQTYEDLYPVILGAGLLGEIANRRIKEYWELTGTQELPPINEIMLDILIEDFNERHHNFVETN